MPPWVEIIVLAFLIGAITFFVVSCVYEFHEQTKRIKMGKEILALIERYNNNKTDELKNQIKIEWKKFKNSWDKFRFKEVSRERVEKMEKFLKIEKII
ncbi:hypothetical protein KJ763_02000 [Patescibacteria group bacterium]|nr:hypothetical protein [Patescibacteria group bacterium]